ncbi:hypothetical protein [Lentzea flava]|uniref:Uncharacterized protein n=1 Tax=Lentzea flava TaxID=103732 RepID=A0ABQ2UZ96_9PSEU|nr:hypothetical protein [Lentzea flava]MCP2202497.1 hypothetical protein [Lentzea flava]GGU59504.1 hypothetical protein GCM10010178_59710 [Lentzea flava]
MHPRLGIAVTIAEYLATGALGAGIAVVVMNGDDRPSSAPSGVAPATTTSTTTTFRTTTLPVTTTASSEYPRLVDAAQIDPRFTYYSKLPSLVQLAPGVYAEPPADGNLGSVEDYSSYLGLCVDVNRQAEKYPGGSTCW